MKTYFISSGLQGCYFLRCLMPLMANGWDGDQTSIVLENKTPENKALAASNANIVVFHRPETEDKLELAMRLQKQGKKIVFDNDDTFKDDSAFKFNDFLNKERFDRGIKPINDTIDAFLQIADLVTCSTEFLAEEYRKLSKNVVVLPNLVDPFYFDEPIRNETDVVRIGIVGSIAVTADMDNLKPIMRHYNDDPRVQFVLFSLPPAQDDKITRELYHDEYEFFAGMNIEWQPFVNMDQYYETLNGLKLDMMIIPRADNYFNRCKSNVKFLEASMLEIPVIAQGFTTGDSPYQQNPEDSKYILIVTDNNDWVHAMETLIQDKERRLEMGKKAKEYVMENYNIENKAHLWEDAYSKIL